jgi:hypothetical protein
MTGFKSRFIPKQYMPDKPTKWGMKPWGMANNKARHLKYKIYSYLGKKEVRNSQLLLEEQLVIGTTKDYRWLCHHIYFKNLLMQLS